MRLANWRDGDAAAFTDIWHTQGRRWAERLSWDNSSTWATLEAQRRDGSLPGLILVDGSRIAAWGFFLIYRGTLQIGAFEADSAASTGILLDAMLSVSDSELAPSGVMLFTFSDAPGLRETLSSRGFETDSYAYLTCDLPAPPQRPPDLDWDRGLALQIPDLFARSYDQPTLTRPFARHGAIEEWREYTGQLIGSGACGRFDPRLSAARVASDGTLEGAVITTVVGPGCVHVAQVAVAPERRGSGLATAMLRDVLSKASADGFASASLLVGEHNAGARRIYDRLGFREVARFTSAGRSCASL
jgi:ribosomal protein S18 acetylase RimI-like enzyme